MTDEQTSAAIQKVAIEVDRLFQSNQLDQAEALLLQALGTHRSDPLLTHNLAYLLHNTRRSREAESLLRALPQVIPESLVLLGDIHAAAGQEAEAFRMYKAALRAVPGDYSALMKLGLLKDKMGDKPGARDCFRQAMEIRPLDWNATYHYILSIWDKDPEPAVKLAENLLAAATTTKERIRGLEFIICRHEWWERIRRGQMPYHATSIDELFFNHSLKYLHELEGLMQERLKEDPTNASRKAQVANLHFALNRRHAAEEIWASIPTYTQGKILENVRFAPAFYDELRTFTDADLIRDLPPVIELAPPVPDAGGVLYLSCNFTYFKAFALPMINSVRARSPRTPVHVHIMDADEDQAAFSLAYLQKLSPLRFSLTIERPGLEQAPPIEARCYYHAVRFIRYYHHLKTYNCPLWLMDVDALVNIDLSELFDKLKGVDVSMRIRPGRLEPWNQFNACVVGAATTPASIEYFRLVAAYLAYFFQRKTLRWGIDQLAMYGVFADMQDRGAAPQVALLGEREVDYDYRDDGFVWCNSGIGKFKHLQRIANPGSMPMADFDGNRFVGAFEHFWKETQRVAADVGVKL